MLMNIKLKNMNMAGTDEWTWETEVVCNTGFCSRLSAGRGGEAGGK